MSTSIVMPYAILRHESMLGAWLHGSVRPPDLTGLVDEIWYFDGNLTHPRERVFADGRYELIVHVGAAYRAVPGGGAPYAFPASCVAGLRIAPEVIEAPPGRVEVLGVKLTPCGARRLFGRALPELSGITAALEDTPASRGGPDLREVCTAANGAEARLAAAAAWLRQRLLHGTDRRDAAIAWAEAEVERRCGNVAIARLRERVGWSKTRFTSAFREQVGVAPKTFARIHRFRNALAMLVRQDRTLSDVALRAGYFDQSHFNAEFRAFTGHSPARFLAARRYHASVTLAEDARR